MISVLLKMYNVTIVDANTIEMGENAEEDIFISIWLSDVDEKSQYDVVGGTISSGNEEH